MAEKKSPVVFTKRAIWAAAGFGFIVYIMAILIGAMMGIGTGALMAIAIVPPMSVAVIPALKQPTTSDKRKKD
jgi:hypothetical protein